MNNFKAAPVTCYGEVARRQSGVTEGADVSDIANIFITFVVTALAAVTKIKIKLLNT